MVAGDLSFLILIVEAWLIASFHTNSTAPFHFDAAEDASARSVLVVISGKTMTFLLITRVHFPRS